jgi:hypothetical protein
MTRLCLVASLAASVAAANRTVTPQTGATVAWVESTTMQQMPIQQDQARTKRMREQRTTSFWEKQAMRPPPLETMERVEWDEDSFNGTSPTELWKRKLWWSANKNGNVASSQTKGKMADPSQNYDKWAQAYRMLGGYIDCDHPKSSNKEGVSRDNNNKACSRWMIWAAVRQVDDFVKTAGALTLCFLSS